MSTEPQAINVRPVPNNIHQTNLGYLLQTSPSHKALNPMWPKVRPAAIPSPKRYRLRQPAIPALQPPLTFSVPRNTRQYPDSPELKDDTLGNEAIGRRIERRNFIALQPGALSLPGSEVVWDTQSNRLRSATLPATPISVTGTAITSQSNEASQATAPEQSSTTPQSPPSNSITENQTLLQIYQLAALRLACLAN